jgi:hypothetical protein
MQRMLDRVLEAQRQTGSGGNGTTAAAPPPPTATGGAKRKRGRAPVPAAPAEDGLLAKVRAWWAEVLRQAAKK